MKPASTASITDASPERTRAGGIPRRSPMDDSTTLCTSPLPRRLRTPPRASGGRAGPEPRHGVVDDLAHRPVDVDDDARLVGVERLERGELRVEQARRHEVPGACRGARRRARSRRSVRGARTRRRGARARMRSRYARRSAEQAMTSPVPPRPPRRASRRRRRARAAGRRRRAGTPDAIFSTFAVGCRSSASMNGTPSVAREQRRRSWTCPQPETPITTTTGAGRVESVTSRGPCRRRGGCRAGRPARRGTCRPRRRSARRRARACRRGAGSRPSR